MLFSKFTAAFTVLAAAVVSAQSGTISTPASLTQCQPVQLSWTVTDGPFYLSVIPGGQASGIPLVDFGQVTSSPQTWNVNVTAGTAVGLRLVDSKGVSYYSEQVTVRAGTSTDCMNAAVAAAPVAGASSAASSASGAVMSASSSAAEAVSSARSSAAGAVSSASGAVGSMTASAAARVTGSQTTAAAAGASSAPANGASKIESTGLMAAVMAIVAVAAL